MSYSGGLSGIITDFSQVSDTGITNAEKFLTPAQLSLVTGIASAPRLTDLFQDAQRDGLVPGSVPGDPAGYPLWTKVNDSIGRSVAPTGQLTFSDSIRLYPQLTGLIVGRELYAITSGAPDDVRDRYASPSALMTLVTERASQQGSFQTSIALPDDVSNADAAPYLQWVAHYLDKTFASLPDAIAQERDSLVYMVLAYARQNALARGSTTLGVVGGSGVNIVVPTELIHYQVELPDGTMYVVMDDVTMDPANRYVYQWNGPRWRQMETTGGFFERNGKTTCVGVVKGTGSWYVNRVFGLVPPGDSCDATPDNFNGPWDLVTPDITAALTYQGGAPVVVVSQPTGPTTVPVIAPPPVRLTPPVVAPSVGGSGGDPFAQDPSALVPHPTDPSGMATPTVPPASPSPYVATTQVLPVNPATVPTGVLLLAAGVLAFLATRRGK